VNKNKIENQEEMLNQMREIAKLNPEKLQIIETSVDSQLQIDFFENLQNLNIDNTDIDISVLYNELTNSETSIKRKKEILAIYTILGEVESYRILENYLKIAPNDLKTWAFLACQQARIFLESNLLEESKIYIASGLGGKDYRLRYFFAFSAKNVNYSDSQKNIVKGEIEYYLKKYDGIIENIKFKEKYCISVVLMPLYVNLVDLIQDVVTEINQYGDFIQENVFLTNEKIVDINELKELFI